MSDCGGVWRDNAKDFEDVGEGDIVEYLMNEFDGEGEEPAGEGEVAGVHGAGAGGGEHFGTGF